MKCSTLTRQRRGERQSHAPISGVDGFQVTFARGTEWAATGKVTLPAPKPESFATDKAVEHQLPAKP